MEENTPQYTKAKHEQCFGIHLTNKSDEQVSNVQLFNYNHKEDISIKYHCFFPDYDNIIRQLAALKINDGLRITKIHLNVTNENDETAIKQFESELKLIHTGLSGISYTRRRSLEQFYDQNQQDKTIIIPFEDSISLTNQLSIEIEYVMPNTELIFTIFYENTKNKN